jgi:Putative Ig domain
MPSRFWRAAAILAPLVLASLGATASATAATTSNPSLMTQNFACSNGVCEVGPGNVGIAFGAELNGTGGSAGSYTISVISGSLPPGLQLGVDGFEPSAIFGTPTRAGTYAFTVEIQVSGLSGTQKLTITIGTGSSDRLANVSASYNAHTHELLVPFYDANIGALYSVSVTSTGKQVFAPQSLPAPGDVLVSIGTDPCSGCTLTVSDSLGSSATVPLVYKY